MSDFETVIRKDDIDGLTDWVWPKEDTGLWDGPKDDWKKVKPFILENCSGFHTVVQAGGGCGMYPRLLAQMFEKVYTFEPDAYNFYCLANNCKEKKIYKYNAALSDRHRTITLAAPDVTNRGTGTINPGSHEMINSGPTPALMIDDFEYEKLDFIYLDIEGYESYALKGAKNSINKHTPLIACESVHNGGMSILENWGYIAIERVGFDTFFVHESKYKLKA
jgi:FkbM family methyltransferase